MKKLALAMITLAISGCNSDEIKVVIGNDSGEVVSPPEINPEPEQPSRPTFQGVLKLGNKTLLGEYNCNGNIPNAQGVITLNYDENIQCYLGSVRIADLQPVSSVKALNYSTDELLHELQIDYGTEQRNRNASAILNHIDACVTQQHELCLEEIDSFDIADPFNSLDDDERVKAFLQPSVEDKTDELPSSHTNTDLPAAVTPGTNDSSYGQPGAFLSAEVEKSLAYKATGEAKVKTIGMLTDAHGIPISGVDFYSQSSRGKTDAEGKFEFLWGEDITFGIDTFTFGTMKGNSSTFKLNESGSSAMSQKNIQTITERWATYEHGVYNFSQTVHDVFKEYPNVINEIINLSLSNGAQLTDESGKIIAVLPDDFSRQFESGTAKEINEKLRQAVPLWRNVFKESQTWSTQTGKHVSESLGKIFHNVTQFHVFNDNHAWGAAGYARGERTLNISNRAFPVVMHRGDNNYWQKLGSEAAWQRDGKPYIVDATTIDANSKVTMQRPMILDKDNVSFMLPFVSIGQVGQGKVMFMGNSLYPSILSCPETYWANGELAIDDSKQQCRYTKGEGDAYKSDVRYDKGSMKQFFINVTQWMVPDFSPKNAKPISVGTNIDDGMAFWTYKKEGRKYNYFIDKEAFGFNNVEHFVSGQYGNLDPKVTPILFMQAYETKVEGYETNAVQADINAPKLTQNDITDLIQYMEKGGNIIFMDAVGERNPEPIARLADAAGIVLGGQNVVPTYQSYCGSSYWCHAEYNTPNLHTKRTKGIVVLERFADTTKIEINDDGTVTWPRPEDMPTLEIARFTNKETNKPGKYAFFEVSDEQEKQQAIEEIQKEFPGVPVCKDQYEYEVNCIEYREGHGMPTRGNYVRTDFTRLEISNDVVKAMIKSANLGDNIEALAQHEIYYRTKGRAGKRLPINELNAVYDNLGVWLWNDEDYKYESSLGDELGFKRITEYLNCYTDNKHQGGTTCPEDLKSLLQSNNLITANGELNPSYPLNYTEKPLTRIMLGRSYWDLDITVDTTSYPGKTNNSGSTANVDISTNINQVHYSAGSRQPTGLWAPQLQDVTVTGGAPATITVALVDDLTGRDNHEKNLKRPPRVQKSWEYDGHSLTFKVPYGGLIYITPRGGSYNENSKLTYSFSNVLKASYWKDGQWVHGYNESVPLAEIDTGHFIYTTPVKNTKNQDLVQFSEQMNIFAESASDFYGRDETTSNGKHRRFTYKNLEAHRHHFVNDIQISIGDAHSGYPVQSNSYSPTAEKIPTTPLNDWLLWHEVGHNLATAPFVVPGSTEVTNNILALYMQEQRADKPYMERVKNDIQKIPYWMAKHQGHAWSEANANLRLVMFAQLKLWAEEHFDINKNYSGNVPSIFGEDQGWNLFKEMHRKAREENTLCNASELDSADRLMICASTVSGYDLSDFFLAWNPGETRAVLPDGTSQYSGGITSNGLSKVAELRLPKPQKSPLSYISIK
ncbi:TPA: SslE/AcfD family lipoprotein zinc metalloprotease [Vibrio cholerae]|uniref:SslE/AcfD family lipoprotein zinc metalloprotease n=1 Tax=Vibrio cholerae TaxID=666 RepID=UPI0004E365D3|nr:SslE/AcfD family lipoprotein zinc metalloprotease [Vibrio cholerae]EGR1090954.1 DUF4092 domain-containing protein [Vibrio cholerae]EKG0018393.1 SslE/AcfD family lipoprotein zinc metalloprotease [Vibrio cholerae]EKR8724786.1 SslE/AcfD family lipoprotein zinc metalloprotease [Vibrio cholerae]ELA3029829.1 SslE/AcfD family lipoprotein zinc metalloprotease [Vibrio cholerae]ELN7715027.1 SslE/AcfD family lipoprotein zinc metalloprotease [Vibrio cholerae]